ncbi:MAG: hypothetical protein ABUL60_06000 [Myxococcales bacterium]
MIAFGIRIARRVARLRSGWPGVLLGALGCASNSASHAAYDLGPPPQSACLHRVESLSAAELTRPYVELARLSATCPQLSPRVCEETLLKRGCDLGADAVVTDASRLLSPQPGTLPVARGRTTQALLAQEARAIRYQTAGLTH